MEDEFLLKDIFNEMVFETKSWVSVMEKESALAFRDGQVQISVEWSSLKPKLQKPCNWHHSGGFSERLLLCQFKTRDKNALFKGNCPSKYVTPKMLSYLSERAMALCICIVCYRLTCNVHHQNASKRSGVLEAMHILTAI